MRGYRDLRVWQRGMELVVECYGLVRLLPEYERHILTSQLLRAAISVPSNIAEGNGRLSTKDYVNHLGIARGSLAELTTLTLITSAVDLIPARRLVRAHSLADETGRMLTTLMRTLGTRKLGIGD